MHWARNAGKMTGAARSFAVCHAGAVAVLFVPNPALWTVLWSIALWVWGELGVTAGCHRLWTHRSYKAALPLRVFLALGAATAAMTPIESWVRDHRIHHKYTDTDRDPHNSRRGLFYSHIGWLLRPEPAEITKARAEVNVADLHADIVVRVQDSADPVGTVVMCFIMPPTVAVWLWGESALVAILWTVCLRWTILLHCIWSVNSIAHRFGERNHDPQASSADSAVTSMITMGEGWHNWHHKHPFDYACAPGSSLVYWNPTKAFIDMCAHLGLASNRRRSVEAETKRPTLRALAAFAQDNPRPMTL